MLFNKINQYLIEREFQKIPTDCDNVTMYATYEKSHLYLINIIELDHRYLFDFENYTHYKVLTREQFKTDHADRVVLLNIILIDDPKRIYDEVNVEPELETDFIDINWIIDTNEEVLIIPDKQIKNVIHLEKDLETLLGNEQVKRLKLVRRNKWPIITGLLIGINIFIWLLMEINGGSYNSNTLLSFGALYAPLIIGKNEYWRLFTANFLHIGATHLFFNCFSLYIFGSRLEKYLTRLQFLIVYLCAGLLGAGLSLMSHLIGEAFSITAGASGAIYGLIGSIIVCSRLTGKAIDGLNDYIMIIFFILGMAISLISPNVDSIAHVGGFIGGILLTLLVLKGTKGSTITTE